MGLTTSPNGLPYPVNGDTVEVPVDMKNLADATQANLTVFSDAEPAKKPGLMWYAPTAGTLKITDGSSWVQLLPAADTGWLDIVSLQSGWSAGTDVNKPQVRQIGNKVKFQGNVSDSLFTNSAFSLALNFPGGVALPTGTRLYAIPGPTPRQARLVAGATSIEFTAAAASSQAFGLDGIEYLIS